MKSSLLAAAFLFMAAPNASFAFSENERICYGDVMERAIELQMVIKSSSVSRFGGCAANRFKQGLSPRDCPRWGGVKEEDYNQYFGS